MILIIVKFTSMLFWFDLQDFGDGGAFPEIHVAQYPSTLNLLFSNSVSKTIDMFLLNPG